MFGDRPHEWPQRFAFILVDQFSMIALTSAIEPLRHANRMADAELYNWNVYSVSGKPVQASNGIVVSVSGALECTDPGEIIVLCSGPDVERYTPDVLTAWLRRIERHGRSIGAICTAPHILARAGLLDGYRCTIHWESVDAFRENFPHLEVTGKLFEIDRDRFTCAGETAAIDLMVMMIARQHNDALARVVADQVLHSTVREPGDAQRASLMSHVGARNTYLIAAMQHMEGNVEDPLTPLEIAERVGLSRRQLERLFQKHLGQSPQTFYRQLRLARARTLLLQTNMSIMEVAVASGFSTPSHFSKCYRTRFGHSPYDERGLPSSL